MRVYLIVVFTSFLMLTSCANKQEVQKKEAEARLNSISNLIQNNTYNAAKIQIDSIHLLYPHLIKIREKAQEFQDTITRRESTRSLMYCDSLLSVKQLEFKNLQQRFKLEKDKKYQTIGNYIHKSQLVENNIGRTFLNAYVDEQANYYLVSTYCGEKLSHCSVKVSVGDVYCQTDTIKTNNAFNHSFTDGELRWEEVTFKNDKEHGVSAFLAQYQNQSIKVLLLGNKIHDYSLSNRDKLAIIETYNLWVVMKDLQQLKSQTKKLKFKISQINKHKSK